jgi:hypothetical protein
MQNAGQSWHMADVHTVEGVAALTVFVIVTQFSTLSLPW